MLPRISCPNRRWFADKEPATLDQSPSPFRIEHGDDRFAAVVADVSGSHGVKPLFPAADHPLDALHRDRPRTGERARRRAPRPARRHAARRHRRAGIRRRAAREDPRRRNRRRGGQSSNSGLRRLFAASALGRSRRSRPSSGEQSNISVIADGKYVVKILRRITPGIHPEIEVGRFLADVAHFENAPTLLRLGRVDGRREP